MVGLGPNLIPGGASLLPQGPKGVTTSPPTPPRLALRDHLPQPAAAAGGSAGSAWRPSGQRRQLRPVKPVSLRGSREPRSSGGPTHPQARPHSVPGLDPSWCAPASSLWGHLLPGSALCFVFPKPLPFPGTGWPFSPFTPRSQPICSISRVPGPA